MVTRLVSRALEPFEKARGIPTTAGGFVSCDCKNVKQENRGRKLTNASNCICSLTGDIKKQKKFRVRKLKGITNVVIREGPGRRKR